MPNNEIMKFEDMAKDRIRQNYTWNIVVDRHEKVFDELMNGVR